MNDDDFKAFIAQPQAWNKYSYTINRPLRYIDPSGERWFTKKGEYPVWVNPNRDGSYTSPGEGWTAFIPKDEYDALNIKDATGNLVFHFWENKDGSPGFHVNSTGRLEDASDEIIGAALAANGLYRAIQLARALWEGIQETTDHSIDSVEDIIKNPEVLRGKTPEEVSNKVRGTPGWREETMRHSQSNPGGGWVFREYLDNGEASGRYIQYHPGGGHKGPLPYWKVSTPKGGTVRVGPQFGGK